MPAAAGLRPTSPEFAVETWLSLPEDSRNIATLNRALADLHYTTVTKASFYRWLKQPPKAPKQVGKVAQEIVQRVAVQKSAVESAEAGHLDLKGIPTELVDALGVRVLLVAKGQGFDKVEDAIVKVATAIADEAATIAKNLLAPQTETVTEEGKSTSSTADSAKNAVGALAVLADAMHRITAARTLPSIAHRNYAEGDRLMGEGDKYRAEAETTRQAARADNAKVINPSGGPAGFDDVEQEDEALAALRDIEGVK